MDIDDRTEGYIVLYIAIKYYEKYGISLTVEQSFKAWDLGRDVLISEYRNDLNREDFEDMRKLHESGGLTYKQIADIYNLSSRDNVYKYIKRNLEGE